MSTQRRLKFQRLDLADKAAVMIAETISLGILSLPSALAAIGILPYVRFPHQSANRKTDLASSGVILIIGLGVIATYTGYVIGQFKLAYPHVHNMCVHFHSIPPRTVRNQIARDHLTNHPSIHPRASSPHAFLPHMLNQQL